MKPLIILAAIILAIVPAIVFAQQVSPADTLLNRLAGKWILKGMIDGKNVEHDIDAQRVLGQQYMELKETSREKQDNGMPVYDAMIFICYDKKAGQYNCLWLDNTSNAGVADNAVIAHAKFKADSIALLFKINSKSLFHTTLSFDPNKNVWHWKMESDDNGKLETFADALMSRVN